MGKRTKRDTPRPFRITGAGGCRIRGGKDGGKLPTFQGVAYTGRRMRPMGWGHDVVIDLDGVQVPSQHRPVLRQHDHEQIVGHTTSVQVSRRGIEVAGVFSGEPHHRDKVVVPAKNGFEWQLSVGADPKRTEYLEAGDETRLNGRTFKGPLTISRETEVGEISFVPLGADGDTSAAVLAAAGGMGGNPFAAVPVDGHRLHVVPIDNAAAVCGAIEAAGQGYLLGSEDRGHVAILSDARVLGAYGENLDYSEAVTLDRRLTADGATPGGSWAGGQGPAAPAALQAALLPHGWRLYVLAHDQLESTLQAIVACGGGYLCESIKGGSMASVLSDCFVADAHGADLAAGEAAALDALMSRRGAVLGGSWCLGIGA